MLNCGVLTLRGGGISGALWRLLYTRAARDGSTREESRPESGQASFLRRLGRRDESAWRQLYDNLYSALYRYALVSLGTPQEAEDVASETFLRALENIDHFEPRGVPIQNWLWRIAHNLVVNRSSRSQSVGLEGDISSWLKESGSSTIEHTVERRHRAKVLAKALGQIRLSYREVIFFRFYRGLSAKEVGSIMGKSAGAVRVLQHRALAALQQALRREGIESDDF